MYTSAVNHAPAISYFLTGSETPGRPSLGAWTTYGLGSECDNLPSFVVMTSRDREASCGQIFYDFYWSSGFLPTRYQGVKFLAGANPVLYLPSPPGILSEHETHATGYLERPQYRSPRPGTGTPRSRPGSHNTRWRIACKAASRN